MSPSAMKDKYRLANANVGGESTRRGKTTVSYRFMAGIEYIVFEVDGTSYLYPNPRCKYVHVEDTDAIVMRKMLAWMIR